MKKNYFLRGIFILCMGFLLNTTAKAQEFLPFLHDNYSGAAGMLDNPASIAGSRYKFDMTLFGVNATVYNNFMSIDKSYITDRWFDFDAYDGTDPKADGQLHQMTDQMGGNVAANIATQLQGLSFMVGINDKISIGFQARVRGAVTGQNISWDFANHMYNEINDGIRLSEEDLNISGNLWAEIGLTYAQTVYETGQHALKVGASVKYLQGVGSAYLFVEDADFNYINAQDSVHVNAATVHFGASQNLDDTEDFTLDEIGKALGFDLGFEYEWRPDYKEYQYDMDGKNGLWRRDVNKYKLKVGVSLLDIGSIKYDKAYGSQDYTFSEVTFHKNYFDGIDGIQGLVDRLDSLGGVTPAGNTEDFKMSLPMSLSINVDYHIYKNFYVNVAPYFALKNGNSDFSKVRNFSNYSLTPRYETPWFGVSLPFQYNTIDQFDMGLGLRLGPIWVGSNNIFTNMFQDEINAVNVCAMVKIPILHRGAKDMDGDKVSDRRDDCVDVPGDLALNGCPDTDGDGIADIYDDCPEVAGLAEFNGCPDTDGDGIIDMNDECPEIYGLAIFNGCPDRDGDSIIDKLDLCPDVWGLAEFDGCPDTDGDLVPDNRDQCVDVFGLIELDGCPEEIVVIEIEPEPVFDEIPEFDFRAIEFASSKAILLPTSYGELNELADFLNRYEGVSIQVDGHTDSTGSNAINTPLSKRRADAVKKYLENQGVNASRITTEGYGSTKPIATNATKEGRALNRRVEISVK